MNRRQKKVLIRIIVSAVIFAVLMALQELVKIELHRYVWLLLYMVPYIIIGHDVLKKAFQGITSGEVFDENFLMAVATVGAIVLGALESGDFAEAVAVMLFYQIGELFQSIAVGRSRKSITELMDIRPDYANIEQDGELIQEDPDNVHVGSIIVVKPGEKIPIDGVIVEGESTLNTSALTGESLPRSVGVGQEVISGCININGLLKIRTTKEFGESTVSKILELVENAGSKKSRSENFIARFARVYTPVVCICALLLAVIPPVILYIAGQEPGIYTWFYSAMTFLVISCPCALVISIPLAFFAGIGGAGKEGILVKGSVYLEELSKAGTIVFDKTGTLTEGVFEVIGVHHNSRKEAEIIEYAALAECYSTHPISESLKKAYGRALDTERVKDVEEISGHGVKAIVDGRTVLVGNEKLMKLHRIPYMECRSPGTVVHVSIEGVYDGHILISDRIKASSAEAIRSLHAAGVKCVMLTGDTASAAAPVAKELDIDDVHANLLPEDKVGHLEEVLKTAREGRRVAFAGDGINDAPVLMRADIGIAMGVLGSDAAIEAADVVLMDDDPLKIARAISRSKKCMRIVYENIVFALGIKLACLVLGALGIANMWTAVFADVGVMIIAVLNSIRALGKSNRW